VRSFLSETDLENDIAVEVFLLAGNARTWPPSSRPARTSARRGSFRV